MMKGFTACSSRSPNVHFLHYEMPSIPIVHFSDLFFIPPFRFCICFVLHVVTSTLAVALNYFKSLISLFSSVLVLPSWRVSSPLCQVARPSFSACLLCTVYVYVLGQTRQDLAVLKKRVKERNDRRA